MNDNIISDSSHRHGQPKEFVVSSSLSVVQMFSAVQEKENRRKLMERAALQGGMAASLLSSESGTIRLCIICSDGCVKVSVDANLNLG
jgi:hypothetical protein